MTNRDQFKTVVAVFKAAYKNFGIETEAQFNIWHSMLGDIPFDALQLATNKLVSESEYPPTIAAIRKAAMHITNPQVAQLDSATAWNEVKEGIRRFGFYRELDALASMSPVTQLVVKAMSWRELCQSETQMADRAHFMKMFDAYKDREQMRAVLPEGIKNSIEQRNSQTLVKQLSDGFSFVPQGRTQASSQQSH